MNRDALRKFLVDSNKAGYASEKEKKWIKEADGSASINFEKGEWKSCDNFFGGEPYGGRTIVFYDGKPSWIMVYYGWVAEGIETDSVYGVLRGALRRMPEDYPFRGPKEYKERDYVYINSYEGELSRFYGEEIITQGKRLIYKANYVGGLVDQRSGV